ncbi:hypothetical protein GE061_013873 [Apolygus lucorum]|uniref:Uncharacterized protein n=1 Tax=Apolygus lucorum TaxID=248454 RepID=A0A8S9XNY4_APOLU|nr:hypothetical protein GE061_013873 [Apolygus lucorum]
MRQGQQGVVIPRRSQSQPVDLSHPPNTRLTEEGPLSPTYADRSDGSEAWRGLSDLGRRRQLMATTRVTSSEEAEPPPPGPQAPIARLDSLQEMVGATS